MKYKCQGSINDYDDCEVITQEDTNIPQNSISSSNSIKSFKHKLLLFDSTHPKWGYI